MTEQLQKTDLEQIQTDSQSPEVQVERRPDVNGGHELQAELAAIADSMDVSGFKCAHEDCGLVHNHSTNKHRASDDFDMSDDEAADMEANPNCHCGLNELAHRGVSDAPSPSTANNRAPIPDSMARHLDASF